MNKKTLALTETEKSLPQSEQDLSMMGNSLNLIAGLLWF